MCLSSNGTCEAAKHSFCHFTDSVRKLEAVGKILTGHKFSRFCKNHWLSSKGRGILDYLKNLRLYPLYDLFKITQAHDSITKWKQNSEEYQQLGHYFVFHAWYRCLWLKRNLSLRTVKCMREQMHRFNLLGPWHLFLVLFNCLTIVGSIVLFGVFFWCEFFGWDWQTAILPAAELNRRCLFLMEKKFGDNYTELRLFFQN